jgi:hypothetical protein
MNGGGRAWRSKLDPKRTEILPAGFFAIAP